MAPRSTAELLVVVFAVALAVILVAATLGVVLVELIQPEQDTRAVVEAVAGVFAALAGGLAGYGLGRRTSR